MPLRPNISAICLRPGPVLPFKGKGIRQRTRGGKHVLLRRTLVSRLEEFDRKLIVCGDYRTVEFLRLDLLFHFRCRNHLGVLSWAGTTQLNNRGYDSLGAPLTETGSPNKTAALQFSDFSLRRSEKVLIGRLLCRAWFQRFSHQLSINPYITH
jgi:hypothetical protein